MAELVIDFDLYRTSQNHQHSKISSLELNQRIPYPLDREKNFARRYESNFDRRLYDEDADDRVRIFNPVGRSMDSHAMTRDITILDIANTLSQQRLAESQLENQPPANSHHPAPATKNISKVLSQDNPLASSPAKTKPKHPAPSVVENHQPSPGPSNNFDPNKAP